MTSTTDGEEPTPKKRTRSVKIVIMASSSQLYKTYLGVMCHTLEMAQFLYSRSTTIRSIVVGLFERHVSEFNKSCYIFNEDDRKDIVQQVCAELQIMVDRVEESWKTDITNRYDIHKMASVAVSKFIYDKKLKAMKSVCPTRKNIHGVPRKDICKKRKGGKFAVSVDDFTSFGDNPDAIHRSFM